MVALPATTVIDELTMTALPVKRKLRGASMSDEVVVIKTFDNEIDATMAQAVLQESGVRAFVLKDDAGGMEPHLQRTGGVRLVINHADIERASEILRNLDSN